MVTRKQKVDFIKYILETKKFRDMQSREFLEFLENDLSLSYVKFVTPNFYYENIYGKDGVKGVLIHTTTSNVMGVKSHYTIDGSTAINKIERFNDDVMDNPFDVHYVAINYEGFSTDNKYENVLDETIPYTLQQAQQDNDVLYIKDIWMKHSDEDDIMSAYEEKDTLFTDDMTDPLTYAFETIIRMAQTELLEMNNVVTKEEEKSIDSFMEYSLYLGKKQRLERLIDDSLVNGNKEDFKRYTDELNALEEPNKLFETI